MNNWKDHIDWDSLLTEIQMGQCIVVVGTELVNLPDNKSLFELLIHYLKSVPRVKDQIETNYFFEHEELLLLNSKLARTWIDIEIKKFLAERKEFIEPFRMLSQLPFSVILSFHWNTALFDSFRRIKRKSEFLYSYKFEQFSPVSKYPNAEEPWIYNLLGNSDKSDVVLTFDDMFVYLQNILGKDTLPSALKTKLIEARSVLFLGVHFDKWYMQMLLRVLFPNEGERRVQYTLGSTASKETTAFIARRLKMEALDVEPMELLAEIYTQFKSAGKLDGKRVFFSYSHRDKEVMGRVQQAMLHVPIDWMLDERNMEAGERISRYMRNVERMDTVLVLLSDQSLRSPYVMKEIQLAREHNVSIIPLHMDLAFLAPEKGAELLAMAKEKIMDVGRRMNERKQNDPFDSTPDLKEEEALWSEYGRHLPGILADFKGSKSISIEGTSFNHGIELLKIQLLR
jgi:hypothetical protein